MCEGKTNFLLLIFIIYNEVSEYVLWIAILKRNLLGNLEDTKMALWENAYLLPNIMYFFLFLVEIAYSCSINIVTTDVGFSNVGFMLRQSVWTKLFLSQTKYFLTRQNIFWPDKILSSAKNLHICMRFSFYHVPK